MTREHVETVRWLAGLVCQMADAYLAVTEGTEEPCEEEESEPTPEPEPMPDVPYRAPAAFPEVVNRRNPVESTSEELERQNQADLVSWLQTVDVTDGRTMVVSLRTIPRGQRKIMSRAMGWQMSTWDTTKGKWICAGAIQSPTQMTLFREAIEKLKKEYNA